jgi:hypothetical protein
LAFLSQAVVADTAYFGAGNGHLYVAVAGDLVFELFIETRLKLADFATTQTGNVNVVAWAVSFVVVAVAAKMKKVKFINEALALEKIDGAVNGDQVDFGIYFLGALEDLVDIEMLFGRVHYLEDDTTLARDANASLPEGSLEMAGGLGGVDAFARRNAPGWSGDHGG